MFISEAQRYQKEFERRVKNGKMIMCTCKRHYFVPDKYTHCWECHFEKVNK